jgi:hypothetical protein
MEDMMAEETGIRSYNDHGNTDLMTVKYELQNGKPVNIKSTTVRSWV